MTDPLDPALSDEILEDCLQAMQRLADQGRIAAVAEVAAFARVSPAVAESALHELQTRGLADQGSDALALTDEGRRQAAAVLRRHRLSERLLTDVLGLPWDRVHEEAMRLEHSLTTEAEARLKSLLNDPDTCPHGGPIPGNGDAAVPVTTRSLDGVSAGARVWIERVTEEEGAFLRYLASLGLLPQAELAVEEVAPFGGPLLVRVGGARYAIGRDVAAKILVRSEPEYSEPHRHRRRLRRRGGQPAS
jgi:DtxR family transcriptional regulator, Mn-dependent transcriptional regulator